MDIVENNTKVILFLSTIAIVILFPIPSVFADKDSPVLGVQFLVPNIDMLHSMSNPNDLRDVSANSISFIIDIPYYSSGALDDDCVDWLKDKARSTIKKYKQEGFDVVVQVASAQVNPLDYSGEMPSGFDTMQAPPGIPGGPPPGFEGLPGFPGGMPNIAQEMICSLLTAGGEPGVIPISVLDEFLENYDSAVIDIATIAEEEGADVFAPMSEADLKMSSATKASQWGQGILPKIKEVYSGKVLWKGDFHNAYKNDYKQVDFSGYDIIGFTTLAGDSETANLSNVISGNIETLTKWADEDSVEEVWITEFGISTTSTQSENGKAEAHQQMFEISEGKLDGYQINDMPFVGPNQQIGWPGTPLKDSTAEPIVNEWFKKMAGPVQDIPILDESTEIPTWVKNNAGWWADGLLSDSDFISGIQWLIINETINVSVTEPSAETVISEIPTWVKNNAGWWANGIIDDKSFVTGIEYLVKQGIILIN